MYQAEHFFKRCSLRTCNNAPKKKVPCSIAVICIDTILHHWLHQVAATASTLMKVPGSVLVYIALLFNKVPHVASTQLHSATESGVNTTGSIA